MPKEPLNYHQISGETIDKTRHIFSTEIATDKPNKHYTVGTMRLFGIDEQMGGNNQLLDEGRGR